MDRRRRFRVSVGLFVALLALSGPVAAQEDNGRATATVDARELWRRGSDQVLAGDFTAAAETLARLRRVAPDDPMVGEVLGWLKDAKQLDESRRRLRDRIYDRHANRARQRVEEKEWLRALEETYRTFQNARNEDEFRGQDWVKDIVARSLEAAGEKKGKGEWRDAFVFYEILRQMYPDRKEYETEARACRQHAHFETFYTPKNEWKRDLKNVEVEVVPEILRRVSDEYVRDEDFRKLCISGLENLILLARTEKLTNVFATLGDRDLVGNFTDRVEQQIGRTHSRKRFDDRDAARVFETVLRINRETLQLPENVLIDEFVAGVLEPLDEFTSVIWPAEVSEFAKHTRGEFVGVGIQITKEEGGFIRVESPLEDTPAYEAGISPGELITAVDGRSTVDISVDEAVRLITGEPGTRVTLTIKSTSGSERTVTLTRSKIKLQTVRGYQRKDDDGAWDYMIDPQRKIGYIRVNSFMEKTVDDLRRSLEALQREGARGLLLDLRFNPGGLLRSAVDVCGLFLNEGEPIVMTRGRDGKPDLNQTARGGEGFRDIPIIILVNEYSASASEIVAGALSGRGKAYIVGSRTYGKGSVQNLIPIDDNSAFLKLTTQYYYIPSGVREAPWRCLHKEKGAKVWGVDPDIGVDLIPYEMGKVLRLRRKVDILKGKGKSEVPAEVLERRPTTRKSDEGEEEEPEEDDAALDDSPDVDPQLVTALNIMRMKLLSNQPWAHAPKVAARDPLDGDRAARGSARGRSAEGG